MKFCIIGLGIFGKQIATTLAENNGEVLAIDKNEVKVASIQNIVTQAICAKIMDLESLEATGVGEMDLIIVCVGKDIAESILIAALIKKHYPHIRLIARATNTTQQEVLSLIGVDQIIRPEQETAIELADTLSSPFINVCRIDPTQSIALINPAEDFIGQSIEKIALYKNHKVRCVFIKKESDIFLAYDNYIISAEDKLMVAGTNEAIIKLI
jgi:trk system potassium uptake protein TrkA